MTKEDRVKMMGKKCRVSVIYEKNNGTWKKKGTYPRPAWIVGFGVIKNGDIDYDVYEGNTFVCKETICVAKVRFWTTETEKNVPLDELVLNGNVTPYPSSWVI